MDLGRRAGVAGAEKLMAALDAARQAAEERRATPAHDPHVESRYELALARLAAAVRECAAS